MDKYKYNSSCSSTTTTGRKRKPQEKTSTFSPGYKIKKVDNKVCGNSKSESKSASSVVVKSIVVDKQNDDKSSVDDTSQDVFEDIVSDDDSGLEDLQSINVFSCQHNVYEETFIEEVEKRLAENEEPDKDDADEQGAVEEPSYVEDITETFDDDVDCFIEAPESCYIETKRQSNESIVSKKDRKKPKAQKAIVDDGDIKCYRRRIRKYKQELRDLRDCSNDDNNGDEEELVYIQDHYYIPKKIWQLLYGYQKDAVKWLLKLHIEQCGGIVADEMGMGKTIQIIAFLILLKHSRNPNCDEIYKSLGPVLIICPATVMFQWVFEIQKWWPPFRVAVLHSTGSYQGSNRFKLIDDVFDDNGILITTYCSLGMYHSRLKELDWHYIILDEGHKIRNPETQIAINCKAFLTPHRLLLSGTPIQNDLCELWSLMDFVYPFKLGSLKVFEETISQPIKRGGSSHASDKEIHISFNCSIMLRNMIEPYLLRRTKDEIKSTLKLPEKNEQVLFCRLTDTQKTLYVKYVDAEMEKILKYHSYVFKALIEIRKICNHPYLFHQESNVEFDGEFFAQSSKMVVVRMLLKLWYKSNNKVLLFTQGRKMLDIIEKFVKLKKYPYYRMDGTTNVKTRQKLVVSFNKDPNVFLFLLTTRVGGLGLTLTGADRVIIFDPDWNPCTDMQARERCWRIGQNKNVIIYRLLTTGTIEEKIYHRQIFKQYLANRILKNPFHKRFEKLYNLKELFTLNDSCTTGLYFYNTEVKFKKRQKQEENSKNEPSVLKKVDLSHLPKIPKLPGTKPAKPSLMDWSNINIIVSKRRLSEVRERTRELAKIITNLSNNNTAKTTITTDTIKSALSNNRDEKKQVEKKKKPKEPDVNFVIDQSPDGIKIKVLSEKDENLNTYKKFEGRTIEYLVRQETYNEEQEEDSHEKKKKKDENYLLNKLLGKKSIETVIQHDVIEDTKVPDHFYVIQEAKRFADNAMNKFRNDQLRRGINREGIPRQNTPLTPQIIDIATKLFKIESTKTGSKTKSIIGNLSVKPDNQKSSVLTYESVFGTPAASTSAKSSSSSSSSSSIDISSISLRQLDKTEILNLLYEFLVDRTKKRQTIYTEDITKQFRNRIRPELFAILKALLIRLCDKHRLRDDTTSDDDSSDDDDDRPNGKVRKHKFSWTLKPEFQPKVTHSSKTISRTRH